MRLVAELFAQIQPVHSGKHQVQHQHVVVVGHRQMQPGDSVRRVVHLVAAVFQVGIDHLRNVAVVFYQENAAALSAFHQPSRPGF